MIWKKISNLDRNFQEELDKIKKLLKNQSRTRRKKNIRLNILLC